MLTTQSVFEHHAPQHNIISILLWVYRLPVDNPHEKESPVMMLEYLHWRCTEHDLTCLSQFKLMQRFLRIASE
jgi:hypothetical protein